MRKVPRNWFPRVMALATFVVLGLTACARDCSTMVEQRCREPGVTAEQCARIKARAATLPHQACEALLYAREQGAAQ